MLTQQDAVELDAAVDHLLRTGDRGEMEIIGAGEITCVVAWRGCACKRLPPFDEPARLDAYHRLLQEYLTKLNAAGVTTLRTECRIVNKTDRQIAFLVQPRVAAEQCLPEWMKRVPQPEAVAMAVQVMDLVRRAIAQGIGIDANLSNWLVQNDAPVCLDVSTPMLRDAAGRHRLDTEIFVATLPGVVRGLVRRYFVTELLDRYFVTRSVFENLLGDLPNSGLDHLTEVLLAEANARIDTPLTMEQIRAYRREDRLTWNAIRQLLKAEQWWRRHILRASHPHLLPSQFRRT